MGNFRQDNGLGISWGVRGLRIGRSQYGRWWISIGLPLGFRITKNLGPIRGPRTQSSPSTVPQPLIDAQIPVEPHATLQPLTENQKLLERMRHSPD